MTMLIAFRVCLMAFGFTVFTAGIARAGDPSLRKPVAVEALDHLARANKLYNVGSFAEAAAEYKAGALIEPAPIFDFNLGQCYRQLADHKKSIWHYGRFIKTSPQTPEHNALAQKHIADEQAALDKAAAVEPTPIVEPANPATAPGGRPARPNLGTRAVETTKAEPWYADGVGWGLAATGAVGAIIGSGLLVNASNLETESVHAGGQREAKQLEDRATTRQVLGAVIGISGVALLATGVVKLAFRPSANTTVVGVRASVNGFAIIGSF